VTHKSEPRVEHLARRAGDVMPGGASHDGRQLVPHGLFALSASGARKTGEDGRSYIDLQCGNGAILLGHGNHDVVEAGQRALARGFNFSAGTDVEIRWAEAVRRLMPAAEQVRFTASGNEACALGFAVARAVTGRVNVLTLRGHYCGWVGPALLGRRPARAVTRPDGDIITLAEAGGVDEALDALATRNFSAVIFEPTGASFGKVPFSAGDARALAAAARDSGSLCIFDETITGFRVAPGGAQSLYGVSPDLTVLGKILGGGLPCGALAGRRDHMRVLDNRPGRPADGARVSHMGTGNGNPIAAAVGTATLALIEDGTAIAKADAAAVPLRARLNDLFVALHIPWAAYGAHSGLHLFLNPKGRPFQAETFTADATPFDELTARSPDLINALRLRLLDHGVDINPWPGGLLSAVHGDVIDATVMAFEHALRDLKTSGMPLSGWGPA
jgi:glutamate-1-semialdehyde 2,1-aminomutase